MLAVANLVVSEVWADEAAARGTPRYAIREIPPPAETSCVPGFQRLTAARRLNEQAQAVGQDLCFVETGDPAAPILPGNTRAFRWTRSTGSSNLPSIVPGAFFTAAREINERGTTVGWEISDGFRGPVWPLAGGVSDAIAPEDCGGVGTGRADGINDLGAIAASGRRLGEDGTSCQQHWIGSH